MNANETIYSCRAELGADAIRALNVVLDDVWATSNARFGLNQFAATSDGGGGLEFHSTHSLDELLALFVRAEDAHDGIATHVMRETLRAVPLAENSLKRDATVA